MSCNPQTIDSYLAGTALPEEIQRLEDHLSVCTACRTELETKAAEPSFWAQASTHLDSVRDGDLNRFAPKFTVESTQAPTDSATLRYLRLWLQAEPENRGWQPQSSEFLGWLDRFEVQKVIGVGGMGLVLKAYDHEQQRDVAIKTLRQHLTGSPAAKQRFKREAKLAAQIAHKHVMRVLSIGEWEETPYLVMPFFAQGTLAESRDLKQLGIENILCIAKQVTEGLNQAHESGLVHRDIKPSNILLADSLEHVVLADFGLARAIDGSTLTISGTLAGTPQFMSPEQANGQSVDSRSDLFSMGSLMFWLATGRSPFAAEASYASLSMIIGVNHPRVSLQRPDLPLWFERLLDLLLAKQPQSRLQSAQELLHMLKSCELAHRGQGELPEALIASDDVARGPANVTTRLSFLAAAVCLGLLACWALSKAWPSKELTLESGIQANQVEEIGTEASAVDTDAAVEQRNVEDQNPFQVAIPPSGHAEPLDILDEANFTADLVRGENLERWLRRIKNLNPDDISDTMVAAGLRTKRLMDHNSLEAADPAQHEIVEILLNQNPFRVVPDAENEN